MRNFIANFVRILGICKDFAGNRVNELGNIPRCGVVPKFSDLEVIALGITAEAFGFDSENLLFHRLHNECKADLPNLISRRQFNARHKLPARLAEEIRKNVAVAIDVIRGCLLHRLQTGQSLSKRKSQALHHGTG